MEDLSGEQRKEGLGERKDEKSMASLEVGEGRRGKKRGEERPLCRKVTSVACIPRCCCPSPLK